MNGHYCDNSECHLDESDYVSYGSWSYTCHSCGFTYRHGASTAQEQEEDDSYGYAEQKEF